MRLEQIIYRISKYCVMDKKPKRKKSLNAKLEIIEELVPLKQEKVVIPKAPEPMITVNFQPQEETHICSLDLDNLHNLRNNPKEARLFLDELYDKYGLNKAHYRISFRDGSITRLLEKNPA